LTLDTSPTGTASVGTTRWSDSLGSTETTLKGGSVILKNGVDLVARVVNKVTPNTTLTKAAYPVVKVSGAQGGRLAVAYAQANNDSNSADTLGVVTETIATNQEGFIITVGQLENINTTGSLQGETWADGDVLYLSPTTPGAITNVKPTGATGHIVVIGYVEYSHAINGKIYVKIMNGWELDELHNVYINTGTLANNQVLTYNSSSQLWENKTNSSTLTVNTTSIASGTVGRVLFEGTGNVLQESANLFWDNTNSRLNIGAVASNTATLDIKSPGGLTSDIAFRVRNHNDNNNLGYINGVGDVVFGSGSSVTTGSGGNGTVVSIGENAAVNSGFSGYPIAIGRNSVSNGNSISIGNGASNGTGQTINANIAIGKDAINTNSTTNCISIGNTVSTGQVSGTLAIGGSINFGGYLGGGNIAVGYNYTGGNFVNDAYAFGKASSATTLDIGSSFSIYINRTTRSFFVNQNSNLVFRTNNTLTSGTHFDANATNTITLHNGTIPATTIANAGQLYVEGGALRYRADEGTITNVGGSVQSVASAATVTPVHTNKFVKITAQAAALTLANPTGTWAEGQELIIRIKDDGTARAITWDTNYRAIGVALPTTTVISKTTYVGVIYNFTDTKWDVIGVTTEA